MSESAERRAWGEKAWPLTAAQHAAKAAEERAAQRLALFGPDQANVAERVVWRLGKQLLTHQNLAPFRVQARDLALLLLDMDGRRFSPSHIPEDLRGMFYTWQSEGVVDRIAYDDFAFHFVANARTDEWCRTVVTLLAPLIPIIPDQEPACL